MTERRWPKIFRVWRAENEWNAEISFTRRPTDEELKALEVLLRDDRRPAPPFPGSSFLTEHLGAGA